jgi:hypothetical protein
MAFFYLKKTFSSLFDLSKVNFLSFFFFETGYLSPGWFLTLDPSALASQLLGFVGLHHHSQSHLAFQVEAKCPVQRGL